MTYEPPQRPAGIPPHAPQYRQPPAQPVAYQPALGRPYGPQPGPGPQFAVQPPKKSSPLKIVAVAVGVVLVLCVGGSVLAALLGGSGDTTTSAEPGNAPPVAAAEATEKAKAAAKPPAATKKQPAKRAGIGDRVRDGKFEFTVTGLDCSKKTLGDRYLNKKAQGRFCVVTLGVKNIGDEAQLFAGGNQKAYDAAGAEYANDGAAEFYANANAETFLNEINPGNNVTGKIVFDVPRSVTLTTVELHDSVWSGGVRVSLS